MQVERSEVPGYNATVIHLDELERFALRNPNNRDELLMVDTVVAFDGPSGAAGEVPPGQEAPYFVVEGIEPVSGHRREMDQQFTDHGYLPPHVRQVVNREPTDHRPQETAGPGARELRRYQADSTRQPRDNERRRESRARAREARQTPDGGTPVARSAKQPLSPEQVARLRAQVNAQPPQAGAVGHADFAAPPLRSVGSLATSPRPRQRRGTGPRKP